MDNIKPNRGQQGSRPHQRPLNSAHSAKAPRKQRHTGQRYWLVRSIGKVASKSKQTAWKKFKQSDFAHWPKKQVWRRVYVIGVLLLFVVSTIGTILQPYLDQKPYTISPEARALLPKKNAKFGELLKEDSKTKAYIYNQEATSTSGIAGDSNQPRFSASFSKQAGQGIKVTDTISSVDFTIKPKFALGQAKKEDNQIFYKLSKQPGVMVYTSRTASVKEDIILEKYSKSSLTYEFELVLQNGLEAKVEKDGSLGVYGSSVPINGNVSTGTDSDAALLEKARQNAPKDKLLFQLPAPVVLEASKQKSKAESRYELNGKTLKVITDKLDQASYPLSIDPTVYIETAAKLMRGNNETNTDFDVDDELIQKSQTTGARIDAWTSTNNLSTAVWGQGTAVAGGYIYSAGGKGGLSTTTATYYTAGSSTFNVPSGVTSLTVKVWGAGAGGGAGVGSTGIGGDGGGGGYAKSVITVTPLEGLTVEVGTGGAKAGGNRQGGSGGGYSALKRSSTFLVQAGGGGGGGGAEGTSSGDGGDGGAGGGSLGVAGSNGEASGFGGGGARGTTAAGGAGGSAGTSGAAGATGIANAGGDAGASTGTCNASVSGNTGGAGGIGAGGLGGSDTSSCEGGGGGGGGRYGGGGGGSVNSNNRGAGGGGGGSSLVTGSSTVETAGSGTAAGNAGDIENNGAGLGGVGGANAAAANNGAAGGIVITYTTGSATTLSTVSWAKFNTSTNAIESPNPGTGACSGWCTNSVYNLPSSRSNLSLVAYNGYLYAMGGTNSGGTPQTSVYIAKIGANGEPQLWHPTDTNQNNWVYWYTDTALTNARSDFGAVAYNGRMYLLGGLTTSSTLLSSNTVQYASISPTGLLSGMTSTGMTALSANRYGLSAQVYNDVIYVVGGNATFAGTPITTTEYVKLKSDGTMNSWVTTSSLLTSGRQTNGGNFSTIFGGYMYVAGGCTAVNASGYCTTIASDVQLASINADGSLSEWNTILGLTNSRIGHTLIAWQGGLYRLGGCRTQDSGSGACTDTVFDVDYGVINPAGEASTVATSVDSATAPCSTLNTTCDLPSASVGNMLNVAAVLNGYLYIMGGCTNNACTTYSTGVTYQAIGSDGTLQRPASCTGSYSNSYCVSSASLPTAISAAGVTIFNGRIYVVGGFPSISNIYYVSTNADGSLGTWQNNNTNTGTTTTADSVSYTFAYARANPGSAGSNPGNLFIFGGCGPTVTGIGCSDYSEDVYKCNITTSGTVTNCSTSGQLQIGTITGNDGLPTGGGLGAHAGAVYANYIYLMGGLSTSIANNGTDLTFVRYAKFDDSNNVVAVSGSDWVEGANEMNTGRRRGAGFGYNGYLYVLGGYDGADAIADIEFAKINVSDGSWDVFDTSSVTIEKRWALATVVSNSYAYVIGGCIAGGAPSSCSSRTKTIQTFQVYNNDSGAVKSVTALSDDTFAASTDRWGASAAVLNGYLYVAGGCISATDCTDATNNVQYSLLSTTDGSAGTWATATNVLPADRTWGQLEVAGGFLYYLGGQNDTATNEQSTVYYVGTFTTGNITAAWSTATGGIGDTSGQAAQERTKFGATVWNNRIYVVGGLNVSAAVTNTVYISPQLASGGNMAADSWTSDADVPDVARLGGAVTAYANNLYLFGGNDGTNYLSDGQFTQINSDGTVDAWTNTTSLPSYTSDADAFAVNGYMYIVGGRSSATSCRPKTQVAPISANTTIVSGNNPTGVGEWSETNTRYIGGRYGAAVAYEKGKMYIMGGGCTSPQAGTYSTGTIGQSTTTVTGSGTTWTDNYIGATITYQDASTATIVSVTDATHLVVSVSKTVTAGQTYSITPPRHSYSVLKSQPQVATYSRMIDTDTNIFPNSWLMNGVDNSTGAQWQASYKSAYDASNITHHQSFDDGVNGNQVTEGNSAYDSCYESSPATNRYSNAQYVTPGLSMRLATTTTPGGLGACSDNISSTTVRYDRFYIRFEDTTTLDSTSNFTLMSWNNVGTGDTVAGLRLMTTAGNDNKLQIRDQVTASGTTTALAPNTWHRIEVAITGDAMYLRTFEGANVNGTIPTQTVTDTALTNSPVDEFTNVNIGMNSALFATSGTWGMYIDDHKASSSDWVGPAYPDWGQNTSYGNVTMGDVASYNPLAAVYSTGTITQSGTTVTAGGGAKFVSEQIGATLTYLDGSTSTITAVNSSGNSMTVSVSKTVGSAQAYAISNDNTQFSRWHNFYITIDASRTFGYPEDVARGPTIADLSLFFTADPSKRLRHGKTFTGGEQQPLDTPCRQTIDPQCPLP